MGSFEGADPDALDVLSRQMNSAAATLEEIRGRVGSGFERLLWQGGDAEEFFGQWAHRFSGMIGAAVNGLQSAAKQLGVEADQQREASAGDESTVDRAIGTADWIAGNVSTGLGIAGVIPPLASRIDRVLPKGVDLDVVGNVLSPVFFTLDALNLGVDYSKNPHSVDTANDEVNTALDGASLAASGFAVGSALAAGDGIGMALAATNPAGLVILGAGLTDQIVVHTIDPNLNKQIVDGVTDAARFAVKADVDEAEGGIDAAEAAGSVVASGVRGVSSLIGHL